MSAALASGGAFPAEPTSPAPMPLSRQSSRKLAAQRRRRRSRRSSPRRSSPRPRERGQVTAEPVPVAAPGQVVIAADRAALRHPASAIASLVRRSSPGTASAAPAAPIVAAGPSRSVTGSPRWFVRVHVFSPPGWAPGQHGIRRPRSRGRRQQPERCPLAGHSLLLPGRVRRAHRGTRSRAGGRAGHGVRARLRKRPASRGVGGARSAPAPR